MKNIIPYLTLAKPLNGYKLWLSYEDGVEGEIDLSEWKGKGVFKIWDDEENFSLLNITNNKKIEWGKDIDMDPDAFYLKIIGKTFEEYAGNKQILRDSY